MLVEVLNPDFVFKNESGLLVQLIHKGWKQVNYIYSLPNCVRGNHYHKYNEEAFYVIRGSFKLIAERDNVREEYEFTEGDMFKILPFVNHIFEYHSETMLISFYDNGVELSDTEKDIWTK